MKVGDEIYVPEWVVRWLMPGAQLKILDLRYEKPHFS